MIFTVHYANNIVNTIDMVEPITEDDLVLISLDNVIIETSQMYGSPEHYAELKRILSESDAAAIFWKAQKETDVRLPESDIKNMVYSLQQRGVMVVGITARRYDALGEATIKQLQKLDVSFQSSNFTLHNKDKTIHLQNGILYSNGKSVKIDALELLARSTEFTPKRVVFIAASHTAIEELGASIDSSKINYTGINYDHLNWKIKNFDLAIADLQREHHDQRGIILDDRDAMRLLNQRCIM
jgi:hypothetical protein